MKTFKGFDKNLKGGDFQYEIGKEYEINKPIEMCKTGFHSCENPLDVLNYYPINSSRYCETEADGVILKKEEEDSKICSSKIKIGAEINLKTIIDIGIKFLFKKIKNVKSGDYSPAAISGDYSPAAISGYYSPAATSGYSSHAATSGYSSPAATSGYSSHAATSGYSSHAATSGENSIACAIGKIARAKSTVGNWIVLSEYDNDGNVKSVKTAKVDGKKIKADTLYKLQNGKFVQAKND
jgi:hypothetical protein